MHKKILTVVGARPQFIKAAAVSRAMKGHSSLREVILHTGQHYDDNMSEVFFREMDIPEPQYNLGVQASLQGEMTGAMIAGIEKVILDEKPDMLLVYGDTNSTIAGALAASKLFIKIIHVEAGLRSHNMKMSEEINRILTDRISSLLCCPTENAFNNLKLEGFSNFNCTFLNTGDVMQDAALYYSSMLEGRKTIVTEKKLNDFILCTLHRAENTNDPKRLSDIVDALNKIHETNHVVLPLHPRTKKTVEALGLKLNVDIVPPQGYFDMLALLKHCRMVLTDSGGLQKESYFFRKPCVTLRDETEWAELIQIGCNKLVGADNKKIISTVNEMLNQNFNFDTELFGGGIASKNIIAAIEKFL
jgi:UDP-GlcNAc3NAcA epimerase